ncbi:MAG: hypothetical protein WCL18_04565 [bacterium]
MTGYLNSNYPGSTPFSNTVTISTSDREITTGNNYAITGGYVVANRITTIDLFANNISRPNRDNLPYGS